MMQVDDQASSDTAPAVHAADLASGGGVPVVSIIIVTYNNAADIGQCLDSLPAGSRRHTFEAVVVDNLSQDSTVDVIEEHRAPWCRLYRSSVNLGFARGVNAAAARANGAYILLVNPDAVVAEGAIDAIVEFARAHPDTGPVGGRTFHHDGSLDPRSCWGRQTMWSTLCFAFGLSAVFAGNRFFDPESLGTWNRDDVREVGTVTGYFLLLRREDWTALSGMDPTYYMYGDDVDLSERARRLGLKPIIVPAAVTFHPAGGSSRPEDRRVMMLRGRVTVMARYWKGWQMRLGRALLVTGVVLRARLSRSAQWRAAAARRAEWHSPYPDIANTAVADAKSLVEVTGSGGAGG